VASISHDLNINDQTIYNWRRQDRIDRGEQPGLTTAETPGPGGEEEDRRAKDPADDQPPRYRAAQAEDPPKKAIRGHRSEIAENLPVHVACKVLGGSESGFVRTATGRRANPQSAMQC
jgi:putative transposase